MKLQLNRTKFFYFELWIFFIKSEQFGDIHHFQIVKQLYNLA